MLSSDKLFSIVVIIDLVDGIRFAVLSRWLIFLLTSVDFKAFVGISISWGLGKWKQLDLSPKTDLKCWSRLNKTKVVANDTESNCSAPCKTKEKSLSWYHQIDAKLFLLLCIFVVTNEHIFFFPTHLNLYFFLSPVMFKFYLLVCLLIILCML